MRSEGVSGREEMLRVMGRAGWEARTRMGSWV